MPNNRWLGVAQPTAAKTAYIPTGVTPGSIWKMRIGSENYQYTYDGSISKPLVESVDRAQAVAQGLASQVSGSGFSGGSTQFIESVVAELVEGQWAIVVTGVDSGVPLDVSVSVSEASDANVDITVLQSGRTGQNSIQRIKWPKTPTAGNLTVGFEDDTASVAYNASAATLETALEGLTGIGAGNVSVSGSHSTEYLIEFQGALATTSVSTLRAYSSDAAGVAAVSYEVTQQGGIQRTTYEMGALSGNAAEVFQFTYENETSHFITGTATESAILAALESIPGIGPGNVAVDQQSDGSFVLSLVGSFVGVAASTLTITSVDGSSTAPDITKTDGTTEPANTIVQMTVLNLPSTNGGQITFGYGGLTDTINVATMNAAAVTASLVTLSAPFTCTEVVRTPGQPITITLAASTSTQDSGIVSVDVSAMVGCYAIDARETQPALTPLNEMQQVALSNDPDGGTFTLTFGGNTTSGIAYNASAATVTSALEALASIGAGDVDVQGSDGGPWIVTFQSALAATDVDSIEGNGSSLTIATQAAITTSILQTPTGPNWWTNPTNWSLGVVPDSDDSVVFDVGSVSCSYGIEDVPAIAGIYIHRSFTGSIGLSQFRDDGSPETLPSYVSLTDVGSKIPIHIGLGEEGQGPAVIRIDTQSQEADVRVLYAQQPTENEQTVGLAGDIATLQISEGTVSLSLHGDRASTVDYLRISPEENEADNTQVEWGSAATINRLELIRGSAFGASVPAVAFVVDGEATVQGSGTCDQLTARRSTVHWLATGGLGAQGAIESIDVSSTLLEITSTAHGLATGDRVFVSDFSHLSVPDGYYGIVVVDVDTFTLTGSAPAIPFGASTPSTVSSYYLANSGRWGLVNTVRLGEESVLDLGTLGEVRTIPAPVVFESSTARIFDPQITVEDLRIHSDPGYFDSDFGLSGVYRREQAVASTVLGGSYQNSGVV